MKRVEFLGASGVGKSTLIKNIMDTRTSLDHWYLPEEARRQIAQSFTYKNARGLKQLISLILIKHGIGNPATIRTAVDLLLANHESAVYETTARKYSGIIGLMLYKINSDPSIEPLIKAHIIKTAYNSLIRNVALIDHFGFEHVVIYDESLFKNNMWFFNAEDYRTIITARVNHQSCENPDLIVNCDLSIEETFRRRKERIAKRNREDQESLMNDDDLMRSCQKMRLYTESKVQALKENGVNVLTLDMTQELLVNTNKVIDSLRKF